MEACPLYHRKLTLSVVQGIFISSFGSEKWRHWAMRSHSIKKSVMELYAFYIQICVAQTYLDISVLCLCLVLNFGVPETFPLTSYCLNFLVI